MDYSISKVTALSDDDLIEACKQFKRAGVFIGLATVETFFSGAAIRFVEQGDFTSCAMLVAGHTPVFGTTKRNAKDKRDRKLARKIAMIRCFRVYAEGLSENVVD